MDDGEQIPSFLLLQRPETVHPEPVEGSPSPVHASTHRSPFDKLRANGESKGSVRTAYMDLIKIGKIMEEYVFSIMDSFVANRNLPGNTP